MVECDPICTILWYKNDQLIRRNQSQYQINESALKPSPGQNMLLRVESVLKLDFDLWPEGRDLDPLRDMANYSCKSTANRLGSGVISTTSFRVHYPPKNITVTPRYTILASVNIRGRRQRREGKKVTSFSKRDKLKSENAFVQGCQADVSPPFFVDVECGHPETSGHFR